MPRNQSLYPATGPPLTDAAATSLEVLTIIFPNPEWGNADTQYHSPPANISFTSRLPSGHIQTLSNSNDDPANAITGLLYVPDLPPADPCIAASAPWVPANVTRQRNLPDVDYELVAIAPWISANCTQKYLASARHAPTGGFLFFLPHEGLGDNTTLPPDPSSNVWNLGDNGLWKHQNDYPVFAIPSVTGQKLMLASSEYSVNMTDVPFGHNLTEVGFNPLYYVRLYAIIDISGNSRLPSLWIFLLVVLAILLAIIGLTSLVMHFLQRRRRNSLRRRVATGDVDLEALGIKRLTVPQDILDTMPLYTYGSGRPLPPSTARARDSLVSKLGPNSAPPVLNTYHPTPLQQPTCAICLDDFVPAGVNNSADESNENNDGSSGESQEGTTVRELPCAHIFHPECVDAFLRDSSSLCPMCKKTALPKGYCPRVITNAMVRRERMVRRLRPQITVEDDAAVAEAAPGRSISRGFSTFGSFGYGRRFTNPIISQQMEDLADTAAARGGSVPAAQPEPASVSAAPPPSNPPQRREWARQRAVAMLGRRTAPLDPDADEAARTPGWKKVIRGIFPGFGGGGGR